MTKEELEKEALAKYKTGSYPQLHPDHFAFIHGYFAAAEPRENRIAELEKENAQLKEANQTLATMNENMWVELEKKRAESQGITNKLHQLIKAKKIVKILKDDLSMYSGAYQKEMAEAEQFLSEVKE